MALESAGNNRWAYQTGMITGFTIAGVGAVVTVIFAAHDWSIWARVSGIVGGALAMGVGGIVGCVGITGYIKDPNRKKTPTVSTTTLQAQLATEAVKYGREHNLSSLINKDTK